MRRGQPSRGGGCRRCHNAGVQDHERHAKEKPAAKPKRAKQDSKLSAIDAAAKVLSGAGQGMCCQDMIAQMEAKGYWMSRGSKTPQATHYSAILCEIPWS